MAITTVGTREAQTLPSTYVDDPKKATLSEPKHAEESLLTQSTELNQQGWPTGDHFETHARKHRLTDDAKPHAGQREKKTPRLSESKQTEGSPSSTDAGSNPESESTVRHFETHAQKRRKTSGAESIACRRKEKAPWLSEPERRTLHAYRTGAKKVTPENASEVRELALAKGDITVTRLCDAQTGKAVPSEPTEVFLRLALEVRRNMLWIPLSLAGFQGTYITADSGHRLFVTRAQGKGDGPPVLVLPGFSGSLADYGQLLKAFRDKHSMVYGIDPTGHGFSMAPNELTPKVLLEDIRDAFLALVPPTEKVIIWGNSAGGWEAAKLTSEPECRARIKGLVLVGAVGAPLSEEEIAVRRKVYAPDTLYASWHEYDFLIGKPLPKKLETPVRYAVATLVHTNFTHPSLLSLGKSEEQLPFTENEPHPDIPTLVLLDANEPMLLITELEFWQKKAEAAPDGNLQVEWFKKLGHGVRVPKEPMMQAIDEWIEKTGLGGERA